MKTMARCLLAAALLLASLPTMLSWADTVEARDYTVDFSGYTAASSLPEEWEILKNSEGVTFGDGYMELAPYTLVSLPDSLVCSDFTYEVDYTLLSADNTSRWFSLMYRMDATKTTTDPYPYMQMCIRQDATASNGVEIAYRRASGWDVVATAAYRTAMEANATYTAKVVMNGRRVMEYINDTPVVLYTNATAGVEGTFGLQTDAATVRIYGIRITQSTEVPNALPDGSDKVKTVYVPTTGIVAPPTAIRYMDSLEDMAALASSKTPQTALFTLGADNAGETAVVFADGTQTLPEVFAACGTTVLPLFYTDDDTALEALLTYVEKQIEFDLMVGSARSEILQTVQQNNPAAIRGVYFAEETADTAALARTAHAAGASVVVLPATASREQVEYLQKRLLDVWIADAQAQDDTLTRQALGNGANGALVNDEQAMYALYETVTETTYCRRTFIAAHRGLHTEAPENTVEAFTEAVLAGADMVECDVYVTADNHLIINHDGTLAGYTTDGTANAKVEDCTLEQLKSYTLKSSSEKYSDCRFATLDELFDELKRYPDCVLIVEIKTAKTSVQSMIRELAEEKGVADQIVTIGFSSSQIKLMKQEMPTNGVSFLYYGIAGSSTTTAQVINSILRGIGPCYAAFSPDYSSISTATMYQMMARGIPCTVWTVDGANNIQAQIDKGVTCITTNNADLTADFALPAYKLTAEYILGEDTSAYYTVRFLDDNGTVLSTQSVKAGLAAQAPAAPIRSGYTFAGWSAAFTEVNADMDIYAQYTLKAPGPVSGLTVTGRTDSTISLSWSAVEGADGYQVYCWDTGAIVATLNGADTTACTVTGLTSGELYRLSVRAFVTADGETAYGEYTVAARAETTGTAAAEAPSGDNPDTGAAVMVWPWLMAAAALSALALCVRKARA